MRLTSSRWFWPAMIVILALVPRLIFWAISDHPGLWDPTEYYNLAVNLHAGRGFTLDYIWSFADHPAAVTHPLDHWLPLPGVVAAGSFAVFGVSVRAALLPFVLLGVVQSLLVYAFAEQIGSSRSVQVFAALATAWMPWLFLSSLHTDSTTLFGVLGFGGLAAIYLGMAKDERWFMLAGGLIGLAILTRNDGLMLIPAAVLGEWWLHWRRGYTLRWRYVLTGGVLVVAVVLPWLIRNQSALGTPWPGSTAQSMFVTDHEDFYAYSKTISLQTYLDQGIVTIVKKILFEMAAAVKLMITLEESIFPVAILAGLLEIIWRRGDDRQLDLAPYIPALCFIILTYGAYTVLMPYLSQGGSFKKAYLAMVPFLLIIGAQAVERHVQPRSAYRVVIGITLALLLANAVELTRADFNTNNTQLAIFKDIKVTLDELQKTDDREVIVMTRDPWSLNYVTGYRAVMVPNESLDVILEVADRYGVTYLLAPVPRAAINQLDWGEVMNPRFQRVAEFPQYQLHLYRILPASPQGREP